MLAAAWGDRKPCVLGHLHELWWWALEYAPDGVIRPGFYPLVVQACEWHGKTEKFWSGLVETGFLDVLADGYVVHDWEEYALRRLTRLKKDADRKRGVRAELTGLSGSGAPDKPPMSGSESADKPPDKPPKNADISGAHATRAGDLPTYLPDDRGSEEPLSSSPTSLNPSDSIADAQGPTGTASAHTTPRQNGTNPRVLGSNPRAKGTNPRALGTNPRAVDDTPPDPDPAVIHADAGVCPLCRQPYLGAYLDHTAEKHRVHSNASPGNLGRRLKGDQVEAPPPEIAAKFAAMHERLRDVPGTEST
jgi:hypothetical protein